MIARALIATSLLIPACGGHPPAAAPTAAVPSNVSAQRGSATAHTIAEIAGVIGLALDADHVYFRTAAHLNSTEGAIIGRVDRFGGDVEVIARTTTGTELATTPRFVWWVDDQGVARAEKGTVRIERLAVPYERVHDLASSGDDVWIAAGGGTATERLIVFENEAATPREVLDLGAVNEPIGFAAADGQLAVSGQWRDLAYSVLRDGELVHLEEGSASTPIAIAGNRVVAGGIWVKMYPLDGGEPRVISELRPSGMMASGCGVILGATAPSVQRDRVMSDLAGGGGRFALASCDSEYRRNDQCRAVSIPPEMVDGTGEVSLIDPTGAFASVATGEDPTIALAVDARGVIWATRTALRAVDR